MMLRSCASVRSRICCDSVMYGRSGGMVERAIQAPLQCWKKSSPGLTEESTADISRPTGGYSGPPNAAATMGAAKAADALSRAPTAITQGAPINADPPYRFRRRDITTSPGRYNGGIDQGRMPMDNNLDAINHAKNELIDLALRFGPKVLVAVLVLIAGA